MLGFGQRLPLGFCVLVTRWVSVQIHPVAAAAAADPAAASGCPCSWGLVVVAGGLVMVPEVLFPVLTLLITPLRLLGDLPGVLLGGVLEQIDPWDLENYGKRQQIYNIQSDYILLFC